MRYVLFAVGMTLSLLLAAGCTSSQAGSGGPTAMGVGGALGAATGAAVGQAIRGKDGWWIGTLAGAAAGTGAGAGYSEYSNSKIPYGRLLNNNLVQSPYSDFTVDRGSVKSGTVLLDTKVKKKFKVP
jgi:hypothetical protein